MYIISSVLGFRIVLLFKEISSVSSRYLTPNHRVISRYSCVINYHNNNWFVIVIIALSLTSDLLPTDVSPIFLLLIENEL